ncbi:MAG: zinc ribbon domain-containing protein [Acidobacteriaceae bacterium]|nr:zinc ribbon domain-containing protein [Acidobacteriaceae bacterium]MBV9498022.1 zinc ribbon domain-containing protein [Acidobacteriaceae bacterium]
MNNRAKNNNTIKVSTMPEYQQPVSERFTEKLRLIRFRMKQEQFRFMDEIRLVPRRLVISVITLFALSQVIAITVNWSGVANDGASWPPGYTQAEGALIMAGVVTGIAIPAACLLFLIGYVNSDAKRRGMHSTLWTLLVIILLPAYLATGFIIYFLIREPLPYKCPQCGSTVSARFNYCPECKHNLCPTCPDCRREVRDGDHYCPHCGYELAGTMSAGQTGVQND